ncbi:MAG: GNAT family N-acetyltransferase [Bacillota bacterium]|nr:GNAT family N-acetyltransferase [Bacillota bacterium]
MKYIIRNIKKGEANLAENVELACFPPNEACILSIMEQRVEKASDLFLVAVDKDTNQMIGILDAISTDEEHLRDEFFTNIKTHNPLGKHCMILGLAVRPEYQGQGIAKRLMEAFKKLVEDRETIVLTCLEEKVNLYKKLGFEDLGQSSSSWGGEVWHEMKYTLKGPND